MSTPSDDLAFALVNGFRASALVRLACELRIPDLLSSGRRGAAELAAEAGVLEDPMRRFLRGLAALGLIEETAAGMFAATELSSRFVDTLGSSRAAAIALPDESVDAYREARHSLETGRPGYEKAFGMSRWEHLSAREGAGDDFQRFMVATSEQVAPAVLSSFDFADARVVVDVGGGHGGLLAPILAAHPDLHGVLLDLPAAVAGAGPHLERKGVADRCQVVGGDFFTSVPRGGDVYLLKFILHDWYDEDCARILASCREAMKPGSALLIVDRVLPDRATPAELRSFMADLQMLVVVGGRERTLPEFEALLNGSRFRLERKADLGGVSLLVARTA